ncbi:Glycosylphosphatidylinositol specific phospholipase D1 [Terramyces sp. JEL0728]|nr:Glycosylphosphatidylinositol specific phospholipase D1 [Terramyces sp. JEL0728]
MLKIKPIRLPVGIRLFTTEQVPFFKDNPAVIRYLEQTQSVDYAMVLRKMQHQRRDSLATVTAIAHHMDKQSSYNSENLIDLITTLARNEYQPSKAPLRVLEAEFDRINPNPESALVLERLKMGEPLKTSMAAVYLERGHKTVKYPIELFEKVLDTCTVIGDVEGAARVFEALQAQELEPTPRIFGNMITCYGNRHDMYSAQRMFEVYQQSGLKQHFTPYMAYAQTLVHARNTPAALDVLTRLLPQAGLKAETANFNQLLAELVYTNQMEDAEELYDMMKNEPDMPKPNSLTNGIAVTFYTFLDKLDKAIELYKPSLIYNFTQSHLKFGYFTRMCLAKGRFDEAVDSYMKYSAGDVGTFYKMCSSLNKYDTEKALKLYESGLKKLIEKKNIGVNFVMNRGLIRALKSSSNFASALDIVKTHKKVTSLNPTSLEELGLLYFKNKQSLPEKLTVEDFKLIFMSLFEIRYKQGDVAILSKNIMGVLKEFLKEHSITPELNQLVINSFKQKKDRYGLSRWEQEMVKLGVLTPENLSSAEVVDENYILATLDQLCNDGALSEAMEVFRQTETEGKLVTPEIFRKLCLLAGKRNEVSKIKHIWSSTLTKAADYHSGDDLKDYKRQIYTALIFVGNSINNSLFLAEVALDIMRDFKSVPRMTDALIAAISKSRDFTDRHKEIIDQLLALRKEIEPNYKPTREVVEATTRHIDISKSHENAIRVFELFKTSGFAPPSRTYSFAMKAYAAENKMENVLECFDEYLEKEEIQDAFIFNIAIGIYIKKNDLKGALRIWNVANQYKISPNSKTLDLLLTGYCVNHDTDSAVGLLDEFEKKFDIAPSTSHYNIVLKGYTLIDPINFKEMTQFYSSIPTKDDTSVNLIIEGSLLAKQPEIAESQFNLQKAAPVTLKLMLEHYSQSNFSKYLTLAEELLNANCTSEVLQTLIDCSLKNNRADLAKRVQVTNTRMSTHEEISHEALYFLNLLDNSTVNILQDNKAYLESGSGYSCAGASAESEEAHWPRFWNYSLNYIRQTYEKPYSDAAQGLIAFLFGTISHGVSDVLWHSLGLEQGFIEAMKYAFYDGNYQNSHMDADIGGDLMIARFGYLAYLQPYWKIPTLDLINIYQLMGYEVSYGELNLCILQGYAGVQGNRLIGRYALPNFAARSPFLVEKYFTYFRGGIHSMAVAVAECWIRMFQSLEDSVYRECEHMGTAYETRSVASSSYTEDYDTCVKNNSNYAGYIISTNGSLSLRGTLASTFINAFCFYYYSPGLEQDNDFTPDPYSWMDIPLLRYPYMMLQGAASHVLSWFDFKCASNSASTVFVTQVEYAKLGSSIATGDFTGDGQKDLVIGAPGYSSNGFVQNGAAFLVQDAAKYHKYAGTIEQISTVISFCNEDGAQFGYSLAVVDYNRDGIDDLAISAPYTGQSVDRFDGKVFILLGSKSGLRIDGQWDIVIDATQTDGPFRVFGYSLYSFDLDNDGYLDLISASPLASFASGNQRGQVQAFLSKNSFSNNVTIDDADWTLIGSQDYEWFGSSITLLERQIIIGSPGYSVVGDSTKSSGKITSYNLDKTINGRPTYNNSIAETRDFSQFAESVDTIHNATQNIIVGSPSKTSKLARNRFMNLPGLVIPFGKEGYQAGQVKVFDWQSTSKLPLSTIHGTTTLGHFGSQVHSSAKGIFVSEPLVDGGTFPINPRKR